MSSATQRRYPESITISPVHGPVSGTARVPGSKSITNRALLIAALANGESTLTGALFSDDTTYMAGCLTDLGIDVTADEPGETFVVQGGNGTFPATSADVFVGLSGTTARFVTAALALGHGRFRLDGTGTTRTRPIGPLLDALNQLGSHAVSENGNDCPPLVVEADGLQGGHCTMAGNLSSQYFTGLLQAAPYARDGVSIEVIGDLVSKPYLKITAAVMRDFGVNIEMDEEHWRTFRVTSGQQYTGRVYRIEPDASNASYFFAAAAITGGRVQVDGLGSNSEQGDLNFVHVLEAMGCRVEMTTDQTTVEGPPVGKLQGGRFDFNAISDTSQTLAAIAPYANSPVTFYGVAHNRLKETDRVSAVATELRKLGQEVEEFEDGLTIVPRPVQPASIATYHDHRMAMSFSLTGLRAEGVRIMDPECVAKTFPGYFDNLTDLTAQ